MRPKPKQRVVTDEAEARSILGIDSSANADTIRSAHRRLIASVHPDRGGSTDLTRRVNAARDLLLKRSSR
nr:DnaJ domain-containing protein [Sphingomonas sp. CFBP 13603]